MFFFCWANHIHISWHSFLSFNGLLFMDIFLLQAGVHSLAIDHKPINPFEMSYDTDMESSNTVCICFSHVAYIWYINSDYSIPGQFRKNVCLWRPGFHRSTCSSLVCVSFVYLSCVGLDTLHNLKYWSAWCSLGIRSNSMQFSSDICWVVI